MIRELETLTIVDFDGSGDILIGCIEKEGSINGLLIAQGEPNEIGNTYEDMDEVKATQDMDTKVILEFTHPDTVKTVDILINKLERVKEGITNKKTNDGCYIEYEELSFGEFFKELGKQYREI